LADSYYQTAKFSQSLSAVQEYFNLPDFDPDIETPEGQAELAEKIEELYTG